MGWVPLGVASHGADDQVFHSEEATVSDSLFFQTGLDQSPM